MRCKFYCFEASIQTQAFRFESLKSYHFHQDLNCLVVVEVYSLVSDLFLPYGLQPARFLYPWDFPGKNTGVDGLPFHSPGDLPDPGIKTTSPAWQKDSLPLSHQESSKSTTFQLKLNKRLRKFLVKQILYL